MSHKRALLVAVTLALAVLFVDPAAAAETLSAGAAPADLFISPCWPVPAEYCVY